LQHALEPKGNSSMALAYIIGAPAVTPLRHRIRTGVRC
jgi:hypothetical protein